MPVKGTTKKTFSEKLKAKETKVDKPVEDVVKEIKVQDAVKPVEEAKNDPTPDSKPEKITPSEVVKEDVPKEVPGREEKKELVEEKKKNVFKGVEIDPKKTYVFELVNSESPRTLLQREQKVWDEETETTRTIRLCSMEASPYLDEQDPDALPDVAPVIFSNTILSVSGIDANKVRFLIASDGFEGKKKVLPINESVKNKYKLRDVESDAINKLGVEEARDQARDIIKSATQEELSDFMRAVFATDVVILSPSEVKLEAYEKAHEHPKVFVKDFTNPLYQIKADIQKLFVAQEIAEVDGAIKWTKTGVSIIPFQYKDRVRSDEALAKWVLVGSKEAKDFVKAMESKLS